MGDKFFDKLIKDISDAANKVSDGNPQLRDSKGDAGLDYVVLPDGNGGYIIDPERCAELDMDPEDAASRYIELKFKDISNEIGK